MTKARKLLEFIETDFSYSDRNKVAGLYAGEMKLDFDDGFIDLELPIDFVDPDSERVIVPIKFTYETIKGEGVYVSLAQEEIKQYYSADDGKLHDLDEEGKKKVNDYIIAHRHIIESSLDNLIDKVLREYYSN